MTDSTKNYLLSTTLARVRVAEFDELCSNYASEPTDLRKGFVEFEIRKAAIPFEAWRLQSIEKPPRPFPKRGDVVSIMGIDSLVESVELNRKREQMLVRVWVKL